jgi:hypothetical protein
VKSTDRDPIVLATAEREIWHLVVLDAIVARAAEFKETDFTAVKGLVAG